ncbi:zinc finger protein 268-like [Lepus europaeus]|uniref:zinc finger protein 268-like n=1 Tax=Lepus europaeus TaxID=9983 RepID=UPI002B4774C4|nr:zinc finger protein 268-like [Lepus europaeus]
MCTRGRTASLWVPPLQEQAASCDRIRKLQGQECILSRGTSDRKPFPGVPRERQKSHTTEQVLEWLFVSQEQLKVSKSWTKPGKLMNIWKIRTNWEVWQKALNVLHLENYVLVQITFIQDKILIKVGLIKRV